MKRMATKANKLHETTKVNKIKKGYNEYDRF